MYYLSTRDKTLRFTPAQAIAQGLSRDGGLFVPETIPQLPAGAMDKLKDMTYQQRAAYVMGLYLDGFTQEELGGFAERAYGPDKFDTSAVAPLRKVDDATYCLELWHGPTSVSYTHLAVSRARGIRITVSTSFFVPKPFTPFQWEGQITMEEYQRRVQLLRGAITNKSIIYNWHDPDTSYLEAVFARGDRRLAPVIEEAWRQGAKFDSWSEYFDLERWLTACRTCGVDPDFYATRERTKDEVLPWSHISVGVRPAYFWREREQAYKSVITPDCRVQCMGCGADRLLECGKCDEALTRRERAERGEV